MLDSTGLRRWSWCSARTSRYLVNSYQPNLCVHGAPWCSMSELSGSSSSFELWPLEFETSSWSPFPLLRRCVGPIRLYLYEDPIWYTQNCLAPLGSSYSWNSGNGDHQPHRMTWTGVPSRFRPCSFLRSCSCRSVTVPCFHSSDFGYRGNPRTMNCFRATLEV